ncbi:MAG: UDP-3-O-(3-hydroxymyristoyl)glucosamine N-acyltransferase [Pirellulales bacterium]
MPTSLAALARLVNGEVVGDGALEISQAATLEDANSADITLVDKNARPDRLVKSAARAVVAPRDFPREQLGRPAIVVDDVHRAFATIVTHFRPSRTVRRTGISPSAWIDGAARLAADVTVQAGATIEADVEIGPGSFIHAGARIMAGCKLGRQVTVYPNAVLYEDTLVGDRCVIHANAVLGGHGFGYRFHDGSHLPMAQLGWVHIGNDVEIGAGSTVDRGTYGPTLIGDGTKIDNLVMIAHNCRIGKHNIICSQVGIAGSTSTGDFVVLAGQVGIRDHVRIGEGAVLGAKSGVSNDVPAGAKMFGTPALPERDQKQVMALTVRLPETRKQLKEFERRLARLEGERERDRERPPAGGQQAA